MNHEIRLFWPIKTARDLLWKKNCWNEKQIEFIGQTQDSYDKLNFVFNIWFVIWQNISHGIWRMEWLFQNDSKFR